jgi:hypothetical protein
MKTNLWPALLVFCLIQSINTKFIELHAAGSLPDSTIIKKCKDFKITGEGQAIACENAKWISLLPPSDQNKSYTSKVKVLYSETGIYFLFSCEDKKLTSSMRADNLNLWEGDVVEVFLWTDEKFPVYFEYELSPYNYELPILVPNNNGKFLGWLPWHYEGDRKTQHAISILRGDPGNPESISGWNAEFFIPYKLLAPLSNVPPVAGTRWRANMYRIDYDNGEIPFSWQETEKTFHEYSKFGVFIFE